MRKIVTLKHRVCDYNCMLSGLEDMVEQERQIRLPEYLMFIAGYIGFRYIHDDDGKIPRIVEPGYGVGRVHYEFLSELLGYKWTKLEGGKFDKAWTEMKESIDSGKPVIAGEMDMYHLRYLKKFYHRIHVPFHYITVIGYDEEKKCAIIQDCGRLEEVELPLSDFEKALNQNIPNLCLPNTFFKFDFPADLNGISTENITKSILKKCGKRFLEDGYQGAAGMKRLIEEYNSWPTTLTLKGLKESLLYLVTFTSSLTPMIPQELVFYPIPEQFKKHVGMRDRFHILLEEIAEQLNDKDIKMAAESFKKSGALYQELTNLITNDIKKNIKGMNKNIKLNDIVPILEKILVLEMEGFSQLALIKEGV